MSGGAGEEPQLTARTAAIKAQMQTPPTMLTIPIMIMNEVGSLVYNLGKTKEARIV